MEHVAGPIHRVSFGFVAAYLVGRHDDAPPVLVDTGIPGRATAILTAARELAPGASPIGDVLLTHCHVDHAGSLAAVVARTAARVHAHPLDAAVIRAGGPQPPAIAEGILLRLLAPLFGRLGPTDMARAPVDEEIDDGDDVPGGLQAIHTPGHTPGHLSFIWPDDGGVLIAGDAAARLLGRLELGSVNADRAAARRSFGRLAELDFETACFGHGPVLRGRANAAFRRRAERLAGRA